MAASTVRVRGLRQFMQATAKADKQTKKVVREKLREAGDSVRVEASRLFASTDARSAGGYKVRARVRGVAVEQSLRKTTGLRPGFGALQMRRALVPALDNKSSEVESRLEQAVGELADIMEG